MTRFLHALPIIAATLFSAGSAIAETEVGRQIVNETLTSASPDSVASTRWNCMEGTEPWVNEGIDDVDGKSGVDAVKSCVAALTRTARDHNLPDLYKQVLTKSQFIRPTTNNCPC